MHPTFAGETPTAGEGAGTTTPEAPKPRGGELASADGTGAPIDVQPKPVTPTYRERFVPIAPYPSAGRALEQPESLPPVSVERTYTVREGDAGFWGVAEKVYGHGKYHDLLARANPDADTNRLRPGQVLKCPPKPTKPLATPGFPGISPVSPGATSGGNVYVVQQGDAGFWGISKKVYSKGKYFYLLAKANPGADTNNLKPGQRLRVPPLASRSDTVSVPIRTSPAPAAGSVYTVREGDQGFWDVAKKVYGDGKYMELIAKANPGVNPRKLRIGQELNTPVMTAEMRVAYRPPPVRGAARHEAAPAETSGEPRPYFAEYASH